MKRLYAYLLLFIFLGCITESKAQYYFYNDNYYDNPFVFEGGLSIGAMNSLTDIGGKKGIGSTFIKDLNIGFTSLSGGAYVSMTYNYMFALRLEATVGKLSAHDSVLKSVSTGDIAKARYNRNLGFRTNITEFSLLAEVHPLYIFIDWMGTDREPPHYSPYLLAGIGYYSYNPQALLGNTWVDLQPLSTEGQGFKEFPERKPYKLQQFNLPIGGGIKHELSPLLTLRAEFVYRKLFTDYLDDLSTTYINPNLFPQYFSGTKLANALILNDRQLERVTNPNGGSKRGTATNEDSYFTFNLKLGLVIGRERVNTLKCPVFY